MTASPALRDPPAPALTGLWSWVPVLTAIAVAIVIFGFVFYDEIIGAIRVWNGSTAYNHCYLVLPLVGIMLWSRRGLITTLRPQPMLAGLALMPFLSALWAVAAALAVLEAQQLIVIALFESFLLVVLGWRTMRALLAPLLFLFFLVPFGAFLVPWLQKITANIAVNGLEFLNIPTYSDGLIIEIPEGTFEIAEACAGLRFLIASIVFGCFFATITFQSPLRRALFIALSVVVPVLANGLRALGIIVLGHIEGSATAAVTDHVLYGWLFFSLVTFALIIIGMRLKDRHPPPAQGPRPLSVAPHSTGWRISVVTGAGISLGLLGPAYLGMANYFPKNSPPDEFAAPRALAGWISQANAALDWRPNLEGALHRSLTAYSNDSVTVVEFIGTYPLRAGNSPLTKGANAIADGKDWHITEQSQRLISIEGAAITINSTLIQNHADRRLVWWFYVVDQRVVQNTLDAKLIQARAILLGRAPLGELIAVSTKVGGPLPSGPETLNSFILAAAPVWKMGGLFSVPRL